ncbi:glycosyltransferase family 87 protein [Novosphingobium sp. Fuku2-ISO-50]|uniref:glycosyltransferase family 87 protein n=1 Tax=Novosphingobium sp. Fuku2-ISO-50 TaxID=1739114 RepID=UPI000AF4D24A|nr:glycosyltransferase family 87 protein [Novosphingobium sp. Fuku2-ISO-50]
MTTITPPHMTRWLTSLGANRWPDRALVRAGAIYMLIAYVPMLMHVFAEATGHVGSDFLAFWGAGRLVMAGTPWQAFDLVAEQGAQAASHTGQMVAYVNPPPYLFLTGPLALMPYGAAWLTWALGSWVAWFLACRRLLPGEPVVLLSYPAAYLAACHAQNGFVTGALLVAGVLALSRKGARAELIAGALFGALVIKPHLALLIPLWLIAGRRWRALAAAAASALALCLLSLMVFGPETWAAWPKSFQVSAVLMEQNAGPFFLRMATPYALIRVLAGANVAIAAQIVITLAMVVLVWGETRRLGANAGTGALMLAATAIASPYLFSYDFPFLVQPLLWLVGMARTNGWRPWEKICVIALWLAPLATRAAALPLHANLMPLAGIGLVWMIVGRLRADQSTISG